MNLIRKLFSKPLFVLLSVILVLVLVFGSLYFADPYHLTVAPGVTVGGLDISGKNLLSARKQLQDALEDTLYSQPLTAELPQQTVSLSPADTQPKVDVWGILWDAYGCGRWEEIGKLSLIPYLQVSEAGLRAPLEAYAAAWDTSLTPAQWTLEGSAPSLSTDSYSQDAPCQTLAVTLGLPCRYLDVDNAADRILQTMAEAIIADPYAISLDLRTDAVPELPDAEALYQEFCKDPVNDSLDMETYQTVSGQYGYRFDKEALTAALEAANYGETVRISMEYEAPEILGDQVYFRDVLGTCQTKHNDNENRNTNLRLLCAALDGHTVAPGEEFSFNAVVGERTREKGYLPAPAYSGDRLVDSVGGGVCQGSTTIYNCVLLADLEVVFRACHGAKVGYVPLGLDASVNYLTTDFKFRNNFNFPIQIKAEVSDGYVKMQILGTDEKDYYIKMETRSGEDDIAIYSRSYKCKYAKETNELISREIEAYSTYYKNIG